MLQIGQDAPEFELLGATGDNVDTHSLSEYTENGWVVVLAFYPFDFHPACIDQLCALRDAGWLTLVDGTVVLGVGTDSVYSHRAFGMQERIEFPLLCDSDGAVARTYGVFRDEFERHRGVAGPALFVVDPEHTIQYAWRGDDPEERPDMGTVENATNCVDGECSLPDGKSYL